MKAVYVICGWLVRFGRDYKALILEEPNAIDFAAKSHGTMTPVYERMELPDQSEPSEAPT